MTHIRQSIQKELPTLNETLFSSYWYLCPDWVKQQKTLYPLLVIGTEPVGGDFGAEASPPQYLVLQWLFHNTVYLRTHSRPHNLQLSRQEGKGLITP